MKETKRKHTILAALLLGVSLMTGNDVYAQALVRDSIPSRRTLQPEKVLTESLSIDSLIVVAQEFKDSIEVDLPAVTDSLARVNRENMEKLAGTVAPKEIALSKVDSIPPVPESKTWLPNPKTATWLAVVFPGGGQIYNRKFWKLPIIYGGFAGCAYALSWNDKMFKDYGNAYADLMSDDPARTRYKDIYPSTWTTDRMKSHAKRQRDYFRRNRDISIFAFIGVYLVSIVDAYVDAELSDFDISPDLTMKIEPVIMTGSSSGNAIGLQCRIMF